MAQQDTPLQLIQDVDAATLERPLAPHGHPDFDRLVRTIWRLRQEDDCPEHD